MSGIYKQEIVNLEMESFTEVMECFEHIRKEFPQRQKVVKEVFIKED